MVARSTCSATSSTTAIDTVEWAAAQPFSNGHVGLYGTSYGANTSWQAAIADPPALGAIAPTQAPIDYVEGWPWLTRDGILKWGLTLNWTLTAIVESQVRRHAAGRARLASGMEAPRRVARRSRRAVHDDTAAARSARCSRRSSGPASRRRATRRCRSSAMSWTRDAPDESCSMASATTARTPACAYPRFITASWYDVILGHDLEHYARMQARRRHARGTRCRPGC